ncbi:hypothetical protein ADL05_10830 [Nocardiopsis sp. NRRL B-16309]|nr:hypothetical protein ADL05_10830 [Nocardiopsis sp. NRRL B-16309]
MAPYNNAPETGTRNSRPAGRGSGAGALVGGALFVGVIAVCALVISYHGIFQFAEYGGHEGSPLAHVFPATYALLVLMAFWVSYMLREARPRQRLWVDVILIPALVLLAAGAMLLSNFQLVESVNQRVANVIVAVAPLAALLVAFLLWLTVRAHIRRRRRTSPRPRPDEDRTTVLPARAVAPPEDEFDEDDDEEDGALSTRLLRLGAADDTVIRTSPARTAAPRDDDAPPVGRLRAQPDAPADDAPEKDPSEEDDARTAPEAHGQDEPGGPEEPDLPEASVPTVPLPRRASRGDNPIKRAVETVPVVPGAARPAPVETGTEDGPDVADGLTDEGFQHEPPPGDPTTDEAEAPPAVTGPPAPEPGPAVVLPSSDEEDEEPLSPVTDPAVPREDRSAPGTGADLPGGPAASTRATDSDGTREIDDTATEPDGRVESTVSTSSRATSEPEAFAEPWAGDVRTDDRAAPGASSTSATTVGPDAPGNDAAARQDERAPRLGLAADEGTDGRSGRGSDRSDQNADDIADTDGTAPVGAPSQEDVPPGPVAPAEPSPAGDLWEPPEEEADTSALDDYVPPVWTPPGEEPEDPEEPRDGDGAGHTGGPTAPTAPVAPAPALDHDTGPEVRAAFRIGPPAPEPSGAVPPTPPRSAVETRAPRSPHAPHVSGTVPPGAARPTPEPEPEPTAPEHPRPTEPGPGPERSRTSEPGPTAATHPEPVSESERTTAPVAEPAPGSRSVPDPTSEPGTVSDPGRSTEPAPESGSTPRPDRSTEPAPESSADPAPGRPADPPYAAEPERPALRKRPLRKPVEKRSMVLKPPRPPMPDFSAEPPSRRVRSEPLPPEE